MQNCEYKLKTLDKNKMLFPSPGLRQMTCWLDTIKMQ